jgi:uncharacterized protein
MPQEIDTVLIKTASRCNLDCNYCYVYNLWDDGWKSQPRRMADEVLNAVIGRLGELSHGQRRPLSVVMHGGEPLLLGFSAMLRLVEGLKSTLRPDAGLHIQTNGVLLTDDFIELFARHDVGISISLDGPAEVHDRNRLDHQGKGSHGKVVSAIARLVAHPAGDRLFSGLLAVVDPTSDPVEVYESLKATHAPSFDFLYRDGNHESFPPGKARFDSTEYGSWMVAMLDRYLADPSPPRIRVLDDIMRLILGGPGQKEGVGLNDYGILVVDTDGRITQNDTLKVAHAGGDRFESETSILDCNLLELVSAAVFQEYLGLQVPASPICKNCPELRICGGGMPAHRWSADRGYSNPTIFCSDQLFLISAARSRLALAKTDTSYTTASHDKRISA